MYVCICCIPLSADNGIAHTFIPDIPDAEVDEDLNPVPIPPLD
jgi:hypothetical protein